MTDPNLPGSDQDKPSDKDAGQRPNPLPTSDAGKKNEGPASGGEGAAGAGGAKGFGTRN